MTQPTAGITLALTLLLGLASIPASADTLTITAKQAVVRAGPDSKQAFSPLHRKERHSYCWRRARAGTECSLTMGVRAGWRSLQRRCSVGCCGRMPRLLRPLHPILASIVRVGP